jgi:hypothetical protein
MNPHRFCNFYKHELVDLPAIGMPCLCKCFTSLSTPSGKKQVSLQKTLKTSSSEPKKRDTKRRIRLKLGTGIHYVAHSIAFLSYDFKEVLPVLLRDP